VCNVSKIAGNLLSLIRDQYAAVQMPIDTCNPEVENWIAAVDCSGAQSQLFIPLEVEADFKLDTNVARVKEHHGPLRS
jgi:hypothetical protein